MKQRGTIVRSAGTLGDWATHSMEHAVSAVYDIPHGGKVAILSPNWMRYGLDSKRDWFAQLVVRIFVCVVAGLTGRLGWWAQTVAGVLECD